MPLGCYLRYYFKCSTKKVLGISFGFTLFFELTQLSGLYGFYSRPYRVCDVDDLILNTLGSMIGFYLTGFVMNILPKRETIDAKAIEKGKSIIAVRRIFAKCIDLMIVCIGSIGILALGCMGLYMLYTNGVFDETLDKYKTISNSTVTMLGYVIPLINIGIVLGTLTLPILVFLKMNSKNEEKKRFIYEKLSKTRLVSYAGKVK